MNLNKIKAKEVELKVTFQDEVLTLKYKPQEFTLDVLEQIESDGSNLRTTRQVLPKLISKWDLMNGKGKVMEITPESFGELPVDLVGRISSEIMGDMFPNAGTTETPGSF